MIISDKSDPNREKNSKSMKFPEFENFWHMVSKSVETTFFMVPMKLLLSEWKKSKIAKIDEMGGYCQIVKVCIEHAPDGFFC